MRETSAPSREDLISLREKGMNREAIADYYNVPLSRVKRWIKDLDVPVIEGRRRKTETPPIKRQRRNPDDGLTVLERARRILGKRMSEDYRGYLLDGRPVRLDYLLTVAGVALPD